MSQTGVLIAVILSSFITGWALGMAFGYRSRRRDLEYAATYLAAVQREVDRLSSDELNALMEQAGNK